MIIDIPFILLISIIFLQILDIYTTHKALSLSHVYEANPVIRFLISKLGKTFGLLLIKFVFVGLLIFLYPYLPIYVLIGISILYLGVIINNILVIKRNNGNLY